MWRNLGALWNIFAMQIQGKDARVIQGMQREVLELLSGTYSQLHNFNLSNVLMPVPMGKYDSTMWKNMIECEGSVEDYATRVETTKLFNIK